MHLFAAPNWSVERKRRKRKEKRRKGRGKNYSKLLLKIKNIDILMLYNNLYLILYNNLYLNCVEIAGLDYEKVWYKVLSQVICHWRAKQWYLTKTLLLEIIKKIMNNGVFI